jgi:DNA-binding NtrC family response regulator
MLEIYKMVARVSDARAAVLITGESGSGTVSN